MREVEKKDALKAAQRIVIKLPKKKKKKKASSKMLKNIQHALKACPNYKKLSTAFEKSKREKDWQHNLKRQ
jgi:hypothetical protein